MIVEKIINTIFKSNTYIIDFETEKDIWIIDPGDVKPIIQWLEKYHKTINGILITHSHFDHIYGINDLIDLYPEIKVYASDAAKDGLFSAKLNSSYYTDFPFTVKNIKVDIIEDNNIVQLNEGICAKVLYTPGHNNDCLSFEIEQYLFTGDALIPGIKIFTKSKYGDKLLAEKSIQKIVGNFNPDKLICPGHGDICTLKDYVNSGIYNLHFQENKYSL